jgi:uncharacterized protein (UPF0297 family)
MNRFKTFNERRQATTELIGNEVYQLTEKGYNPITTGKFFIDHISGFDPKTGFIDALNKAFDLLKLEGATLQDIRNTINFFEIATNDGIAKRFANV